MHKSVHRRFVFFVSLGSLLFSLVVGFILFVIEYRTEHERADQNLSALVSTVRVSASVAAFAQNTPIAEDVVNGLISNPIISEAWIESVDDSGENKFNYRKAWRKFDSTKDEAVVYSLYSPVNQTEVIGTLGVRKDSQIIRQNALKAATRYAVLLILQIPLIALLIAQLFGRMIGRPLSYIAQTIKEIKLGSSARIRPPPNQENNEISVLVDSANSLLDAAEQALHEERRLRAEVEEIENHFQRIFETTSIGVMILKADGRLVSCNPVLLARISGLSSDELETAKTEDFLAALFAYPDYAWSMIHEAQRTGQIVAADLQTGNHAKQEYWVHCMFSVSSDSDGNIEFIEGILYDVTARRAKETEARRAAEIDNLTGLSNRLGMEIFLDRVLRLSPAKNGQTGLLMLDLDGFKGVNDVHGHAAGDAVLREVANRINMRIRRSTDLAVRLGGDEFVVIASDFGISASFLEEIARDLIASISAPISINDKVNVTIGVSIGIAHAPRHGKTRDKLLFAADTAMYLVKQSGKNNYIFATDA